MVILNTNKEKTFEKREELIDVAMIEFGEKGYENASLNNILRKAGISKGTFYYHYKNKEDLYMNLMDIIIEEKLKFISTRIDSSDFNKDVFSVLKLLIKVGMEFAHINPNINKFAQSYIKETGTEDYNKRMKKYYERRKEFLNGLTAKYGFHNMDYLGVLIEKAYDEGQIREDLPKEFVIKLINYLFQNLEQIISSDGLDEYEMAANYLVDFIRNGLAKD